MVFQPVLKDSQSESSGVVSRNSVNIAPIILPGQRDFSDSGPNASKPLPPFQTTVLIWSYQFIKQVADVSKILARTAKKEVIRPSQFLKQAASGNAPTYVISVGTDQSSVPAIINLKGTYHQELLTMT